MDPLSSSDLSELLLSTFLLSGYKEYDHASEFKRDYEMERKSLTEDNAGLPAHSTAKVTNIWGFKDFERY